MKRFRYSGSELDLFACVFNWKSYWSRYIRPFIAGDVLEVGAGIGSNTPFLDSGGSGRWLCLEPDHRLLTRLKRTLKRLKGSRRIYEAECGTLSEVYASGQRFDTILYIDVLEHIHDDRAELRLAASCLRAGGGIVVLSPAHQWLFNAFDSSIGHFRRYNRRMLRNISPVGLYMEKVIYLDSVGMLASAANSIFLRQQMPTQGQLRFWDRYLVPASRVLDRLLLNSVGKSILAVWRLPDAT